MIVKGHDFPAVTLVGVLAADMSLHVSDYRASERTFQLLTQAAGRAGRGNRPGEVVIQTYQPEHYSIQTAKRQDYQAFFEEEISFRKMLRYPPVWNMLVIHIAALDAEEAGNLAKQIHDRIMSLGIDRRKLQVIGPSDALIAKVNDVYKKVIYLKSADYEGLIRIKDFLEKQIMADPAFRTGTVQFDFNPMNGF